MADIVKTVRTDFKTTGLEAGAAKMTAQQRAAQRLNRELNRTKRSLLGLAKIGKTLTFGGGFLGLGAVGAAAGLLKIASAAEDSQLAITGLIQKSSQLYKGTAGTFEQAFSAAQNLRAEFRRLAEASPVTSEAISKSFAGSTMVLSSMGVSLKAQAQLARSTAIADMTNAGSPAGTAARDVTQLLRGQFSAAQISTPALAGNIGRSIAKAAKSGQVKQALDLLNQALTPSPKLLSAYQTSFGGLMATLKDQLQVLGTEAGKPLLEFAAKKLKEWNKWLKANRGEARRIAKAIGTGLLKGIRAVFSFTKLIIDNWQLISGVVSTLAKVWLVQMVTQMGRLVAASAVYARNMKAGQTAGAVPGGGKGRGGKVAGALTGAIIGEGIGQSINAAFGTGTQASVFGVIADAFTGGRAGGISFGTSREQAAINAQNARMMEQWKAQQQQGKQTDDVTYGGGGGGRKGKGKGGAAKVSKMEVDKLEMRGSELVRVMAPLTRQIDRSIKARSPRSALFGLGSLTVANGVE